MTPVDAIPGYKPPVELGCTYDPEAARKLLAEAGYPGGQGFPQDYKILYNTGAGHENIAQVIQQVWKRELNINIGLDGVEKNRTMDLRRKTQFAVARGGWFGDYRDPTTFLEQHVTGDGHNNAAYSSPEFDRFYHEAAKELDPKKRFELLLEAERVLTREQPITPIYQYNNLHVFDPDAIEDLNPNLWNYRRLNEVKVKMKSDAKAAGSS
jgi:oligopeptide transport system substrate-binding protein